MPDIAIGGQVTIIKPTDSVLKSQDVLPCSGCGDANSDNRAIRPWGFAGSELYCTACGKILGQIGT